MSFIIHSIYPIWIMCCFKFEMYHYKMGNKKWSEKKSTECETWNNERSKFKRKKSKCLVNVSIEFVLRSILYSSQFLLLLLLFLASFFTIFFYIFILFYHSIEYLLLFFIYIYLLMLRVRFSPIRICTYDITLIYKSYIGFCFNLFFLSSFSSSFYCAIAATVAAAADGI